jgi:gamma-butyrobetaine hydroxylase
MDVTTDERTLTIAWPSGGRSRFHALWLRDNCPCGECRHESGQRLLDTRVLADDLAVVGASVNGTVDVAFSDGHASSFDPAWLLGYATADAPPVRRLWGAELQPELPAARYDDVAAGGAALRDWLAAVDELGFALLTGCGTEPGTVTRVAELFGYVRETNYGRLFDVRTVVSPTNLAYTALGLGAHSDNPYRDPAPTLQLLHCLASSAQGGASTLVDAFRVAQDLPLEDFELLTGCTVTFRYADAETELETEVPVIEADVRGDVQAVHYNTRSAQPFRLPEDVMGEYYDAYLRFGRMLESPDYRIELKLGPGDLFIADNLRVLHGRTGYAASAGERHLQGCYADRDGLRSKLAVLSRG